jgi:hypothetical protein
MAAQKYDLQRILQKNNLTKLVYFELFEDMYQDLLD